MVATRFEFWRAREGCVMSKILKIRCDGCGREDIRSQGKDADSFHVLRHRLAGYGWKGPEHGLKGGRDYCPDCVAKGLASGPYENFPPEPE